MTALDQHALDAALSAWHATYRDHPVTDRQEFEEAVAEATEDALATYLRETRLVNGGEETCTCWNAIYPQSGWRNVRDPACPLHGVCS